MASPDGNRLKRFLLAKEFAEVFQSQQFQAIPVRRLTQAYQSKHRKNFSPRQLGFSNLEKFVDGLPIFSRVQGDTGSVVLSRSKFLEFFFRPVWEQYGGITSLQRTSALSRTFKSCTGIKIESICKVLQVSTVEELLSELMSEQGEQTSIRGAALHTGERNEHLHGCTDGEEGESSQSEDSSSIQSSRERDRARVAEGASPADRDPLRMDIDEYPLLSRPPRVLLPHPQLPIHSVVGGSPPAQVLRPPPPQPFPPRAVSPNMPNIKPLWHNMPINLSSIPPQQSIDPRHPHKEMVSPHRPHHGQEREGMHLISHQRPLGAVGGGGANVQIDPLHHPDPPSGGILPEYLPLSPGPGTRFTPRRISRGSSPSLSPGPQPHIVAPQVISSRMPPAAVRHPSPLSQQQPLMASEMVPKFPYPDLALEQETILPSHSAFRPDLPIPRTPPGATELSSSKKKKGAVDTKQRAIEKINAKVEELLGDLSSQGKFLQSDIVRRLVLEMINMENRGRQDRINIRDITAMYDYSKVHGRVEELIKVFCWFSPVTSLHELEQAIIESEKVDKYEALHLGPITKHPKVIDLFKLQEAASLDTVPDISAYKIQNYLMKFLSKRKRSEKQSLEGFLEYIREREFAESVYHLCIRITSFPLAIQTNFRFRTSQTQARRRMEVALEEEMKVLLQHETEKLRKKLSGAHADDPLSIRRDLARKDPIQILLSVFDACNNHFRGSQQAKVGTFMQMITEKPALRHLFLLAIYEGAYGADVLMPKFMEDHLPAQASGAPEQAVFLQPQGDVLREVVSRLKRTRFPIDLGSLARVEEMIVDKFGAPNFDSLGNGSFLGFVASHDQVCEALGGRLIGTNSSSAHIAGVKKKVMSIIQQLKFDKRDDQDAVSACVISQFGVDSFEDLSCGSVHKIISESQDSQQVAQTSAISYLYPLLLNGGTNLQEAKQGVGVLGHQNREDALSCLQKAPLLEDLKEWSHWELVYQPQLGPLETFLMDSQPPSAVHALEVAPGKLIRIDPNSSVSEFINSLGSDCHDPINTAGHLVSLIVKRGSIQDISPQLLASHVTTCLEKMLTNDDEQDASIEVAQFVYQVLVRIPLKICQLLASELFIDPLRKVTSSASVDGLVKLCTTPKHRRFFQALGMAIGIKAWADDFKAMLAEARQRRDKSSDANVHSNTSQTVNMFGLLKESSDDVQIATAPGLESTHLTDDEEFMEISEAAEYLETNNSVTDIPQTDEELEERESSCKTVVQAIRHGEFGIGIDLDPQQQLVAEKQREREGRGIKRLSLELYSKDTHFVLELIQNADDNDYYPHFLSGRDPSGEVPSLKFIIGSHAIIVLNNEVGFSEKNIRAICNVGKSTKGAHRSGYIGQKGIGFKSVFRVTDKPEIHSNGFHIGFDASADPIGFILPHWIENHQSIEEKMWRTKIVLNLKESHLTSNMAKKFNDIQPSLLLFLHRLRSITVMDEVSGEERCMVRRDKQRGIVDIQHTNGVMQTTDRWLVVKKLLDKASEFKPDVEATELALAFPITPDLRNITIAKDLQQQQVFAFLPLRSYGFRFILQGDFDLPSSREDVNSDSPWNQWLREEIPPLFLKALDKLKELPGVSVMQAVAQFLQFVPLEGELHDFFQPVTSQILSRIKGTNCLPSDPLSLDSPSTQHSFVDLVTPTSEQSFSNDQVVWKQPSQLLFVKEKFGFIREHISQALLMTSLKLSYLNSSLLPFVNSALQYQLGMCSITVDHLVEIAQVVIKLYKEPIDRRNNFSDSDSDSEESSDEETFAQTIKVQRHFRKVLVRWIANWLACVHMVMEDSNDMGTETIDKLKKFALLPLEDGTMATTSGGSLFFPPDSNTGEKEFRSSSREFKSIYKEMRVVESALFEEGEVLVQSRVRKVLELIGVRNLYPLDIIKHHILPQFTTGTWKTKKMDLLCNFLVYIKECMEQPGSGIKEAEIVHLLKDSVVLVTNQGPKLPSKEVVHFSSSYLPDPDLEKLFPDVKWTVIRRDYVKGSNKKDNVLSWVRFLRKLGVKQGIAVQRDNVNVMEDSPEWKRLHNHESHWSRLPPGGLTLRDWKSEEFEQIIKSVVGKSPSYQQIQMKKLAELLDKHWETEYKHYLEAQIYDEKNDKYLDSTTASSFQQFLIQQAWLPCDGLVHLSASKPLFSGRELFDSTQYICNLLHSHVPYIGAELKSEDFVNRLGIKRNVNKEDVMKHLTKWSQESSDSGVPFCTSIEHMSHVYVFLKQENKGYNATHASDKTDSEDLIEKFHEEKLIYVPDKFEDKSANVDVSGHFETVHTVCWKDPSSVLYTRQRFSLPLSAHLPKVLSLYYVTRNDQSMSNQVQQAFLHFGVPEAPRVASYITLLKFISTLSHHPEPEHVKDFTSIAFELVRLCNEDTSVSRNFIYSNLKNAKVFPTENHVWMSLQECLVENDDKNIAKCFQKSDEVFFILWPDNIVSKKKSRDTSMQQILANQEARENFISICKISKLSAVATPRVDYRGEARPVDNVKRQLSNWISVIQQFIATNLGEVYTKLKDDNIQDKLYRLQIFSVVSLSCRYFIDHNGSQIASPDTIEKSCEYRFDGDTSTIYIAADKVERLGCLHPALMKLFAQNSSGEESNLINNFLKELLLDCPESKDELEELAEKYDVDGLPADEPVWEIPLPKHQQTVEAEENTTDEETDSTSTEEEEVKEKPDSGGMEVVEEGRGLTSWPPKAAVDPSDIVPCHMKRFSAVSAAGESGFGQHLSSSVIGEDELREARRKHLQGYSESSVDPEENPRKIPRVEELATPSDIMDSENIQSPRTDSSIQGTKSYPDELSISFKSDDLPGTQDTLPGMKANVVKSEQKSEQDLDKHKQKFRSNDSQIVVSYNYPNDSRWKAVQRLDSEIELVDIQEFVRNTERNSATPLVELMEDVSLDDEESRFKIGRWGEQYVYIILQKKGHLPDGTRIRSISWTNKDEETNKPYDIVVELESNGPSQQFWTIYIEVKSTAADKKELVSISWTQLKFAEDHGENFHLYRVYSAGKRQSRLCMLENLYGYIKDHHVRFSFVL